MDTDEITAEIRTEFLDAIAGAEASDDLERLRVAALGKKGRISQLMRGLGAMSELERKRAGPAYNRLKTDIADAIEARRRVLDATALARRLAEQGIDVTLPARPEPTGSLHPVSQVLDEITEIFADMGFAIAEGPDIETDFNNFTALNIPPEHPARQMHDTFYLPEKDDGSRLLLRTHTSPVQIRTMMASPPPHRIVIPGRTYRCDYDMTHTPMFHQIEGLVVDRETHMGHLKGCLIDFARAFFEVADLPLRFRPSYFPFTEPSAEVDIGCSARDGGFRIGKGEDWMEILGCGMVHDRVLENCGLDPAEYQGFAFGIGIDRIAMLKYGIRDLRSFFDSDLRWLRHYGFAALDVPTLGQGLSR
ncbi:MAG: phenylalanine--tRNA ligase subunit alpha [Alphaproteobacteria bacterium]|nr:phenylalanine--tRNA ligase subunit alpha [Alphaproteobacteria bacterium]MDP6515652.1 phenylalanine--tRNA ligase subunit alpha [Alphaproteobacteria bacterium]